MLHVVFQLQKVVRKINVASQIFFSNLMQHVGALYPELLDQFGLGPSRVGPQTSRPLGASFLASEYGLKNCSKFEVVLCNFEDQVFDARQWT